MNWNILYAMMAAAAGSFIALQASANSMFRRNLALTEPWYAAFFSICGTFITAVVLMLTFRPSPPDMEAVRSTQWWNWIGGPLGAMIVLAGAALTEKLGAAAFIALVVGGQLMCAMILDHFALMGLSEQPITWGRIAGALLVVAGVGCIKYL
ncbi:DMT family transporter [Zavarzinella formosa]|uniref:DMT family transporter n=1 Tax=Zavarzinella formosa TaxID=360055 RepID=UPI0002FF8EC3|nr:DMT family transporter [Zavarzinella formosa]